MILGTPQQNGVAKRTNYMLLEIVRSMMAQVNLPIKFWEDVLLITICILNHVPLKFISTALYELWNSC